MSTPDVHPPDADLEDADPNDAASLDDGGSPRVIQGQLLDEAGMPVAGAIVALAVGVSTMTDDGGRFTFSGVTPPYDLAFVKDAWGWPLAGIYRGLTRDDPTLVWIRSALGAPNAGLVRGDLSGAGIPIDATRRLTVELVAPRWGRFPMFEAQVMEQSYRDMAGWFGIPENVGTIHALVAQLEDGVVTSFPGYGRRDDVTVAAHATSEGQDIALDGPVPAQRISGRVTASSIFDPSTVQVEVTVDFGDGELSANTQNGAGPFDLLVPIVADTTVSLAVRAGRFDGQNASSVYRPRLRGDETGLSLELPSYPIAHEPPSGATIARGAQTTFRFTATPGTVSVFFVGPNIGSKAYVVTSGDREPLPDLAAFGIEPLPLRTNYVWRVLGFGPATTVDEAAGPSSPLIGFALGSHSGERVQTAGGGRSFSLTP